MRGASLFIINLFAMLSWPSPQKLFDIRNGPRPKKAVKGVPANCANGGRRAGTP